MHGPVKYHNLPDEELKSFLELKCETYYRPEFVNTDPVQIPHRFQKKEDIEISAFLTATLTWGRRTAVIDAAERLLTLMDYQPAAFILESGKQDLNRFKNFVYRTFNGIDAVAFIHAIRRIYLINGGLEPLFTELYHNHNHIMDALAAFHTEFVKELFPARSVRHVANPSGGSAAKRINMFLRWMVRRDPVGIDFGLWSGIPMHSLMIPLDVHVGRVARRLGLLTRKSNDRKAVEELTANLSKFDAGDPVRYDYALFGLGRYERF